MLKKNWKIGQREEVEDEVDGLLVEVFEISGSELSVLKTQNPNGPNNKEG